MLPNNKGVLILNNKFIITIGRQYGSGGREIGELLAKKLNIKFYDNELISLVAKESGMDPDVFKEIDEKATNSLLYSLSLGVYSFGNNFTTTSGLPINDKLYLLQHQLIKKLADEGPCVIVGRCADYILRERNDVINIFICADNDYRVSRVTEIKKIKQSKAEQNISKMDKSRANYYNFYSGQKWGLPENYDLCINRTKLTTDKAVDILLNYINSL